MRKDDQQVIAASPYTQFNIAHYIGGQAGNMHAEEIRQAIRSHMPQLDALRGIAILWVILHNAALDDVGGAQGIAMKLVVLVGNIGWVGVQLFFVLSGFLITGILLDGLGTSRQFRNFYARRTLRIFPLYYGFLLLAFVLLPGIGLISWTGSTAMEQLLYWTYLSNWALFFGVHQNFGHLWSLAIEEQYYLVWALVVILLQKRTVAFVCLALVASAFLFRLFLVLGFDPEYSSGAMYTFTFARWDSLAIGSLLALMVRSEKGIVYLQRYVTPSFVVLTGIILIQIVLFRNFESSDMGGVFNQTSVAFWFAMLILLSIVPWNNRLDIIRVAFSSRVLRWFGKYSYAIYLFHFPAKLFWFSHLSVGRIPGAHWHQLVVVVYNFCGVTLLATVAALLSWYMLEQPFLRLKRRFPRDAKKFQPGVGG